MEHGKPSRTALRVAIRRAAHQLADSPRILLDPIAVPLIGPGHENDLERAMHTVARDFRLFMAARSRYAEDRLAEAVEQGVRQYVVLGAGLDTFACRNPFPHLRVFEVDFPATQLWKQEMLAAANISPPASLSFVPLDFEHKALGEGLREAGFDAAKPAFFGWLGVVPYLTLDAFRATLHTIAALPPASGVSFDYAYPRETMSAARRRVFDGLAERVARAGEPFRLFFTREQLKSELRAAGFTRIVLAGTAEMNAAYFAGREDGLKLSDARIGDQATAWV